MEAGTPPSGKNSKPRRPRSRPKKPPAGGSEAGESAPGGSASTRRPPPSGSRPPPTASKSHGVGPEPPVTSTRSAAKRPPKDSDSKSRPARGKATVSEFRPMAILRPGGSGGANVNTGVTGSGPATQSATPTVPAATSNSKSGAANLDAALTAAATAGIKHRPGKSGGKAATTRGAKSGTRADRANRNVPMGEPKVARAKPPKTLAPEPVKLKVVVRRLPPSLPEAEFWAAVAPFVPFPVPEPAVTTTTAKVSLGLERFPNTTELAVDDASAATPAPEATVEGGTNPSSNETTEVEPAATKVVERTVRLYPASPVAFRGDYQCWYFPGKVPKNRAKTPVLSRAYIGFTKPEELVQFNRDFNGHVFTDDKDPDFQQFVNQVNGLSVTTNGNQSVKNAAVVAPLTPSSSSSSVPKSTHLLDYLRQKKAGELAAQARANPTTKQPGVLILNRPLPSGGKAGHAKAANGAASSSAPGSSKKHTAAQGKGSAANSKGKAVKVAVSASAADATSIETPRKAKKASKAGKAAKQATEGVQKSKAKDPVSKAKKGKGPPPSTPAGPKFDMAREAQSFPPLSGGGALK